MASKRVHFHAFAMDLISVWMKNVCNFVVIENSKYVIDKRGMRFVRIYFIKICNVLKRNIYGSRYCFVVAPENGTKFIFEFMVSTIGIYTR